METIQKRYYHIKGTPRASELQEFNLPGVDNYVEASVWYDKGGYSLFTYRQTPRGYFLSAHKLRKGEYSESVAIFANDGFKQKISECQRKSKKLSAEAEDYFESKIEELLQLAYPDLELELDM